jgi:hypothetical protein
MRIKTLIRLVLPLITLLSLVACNGGAANPTAVPNSAAIETLQANQPAETATVETATGTAAAGTGTQGACANSLFPVVKGATWTYAGSGGTAGSYSYTDTVTDVRPDGFKITSTFDNNLARTQQWNCKPEGLVALQLPGAAAVIATQQMHAELVTSNVQGVTLPSSISPGDEWPFSLDLKGTQEVSGAKAQTTSHAVYNFKAVGVESVTVPAGTFDAMKINGDLTLKVIAKVSGLSIPVTVTLHTVSWFAPGVGMVKAASNGDLMGTALNDTLQLQTYHIP